MKIKLNVAMSGFEKGQIITIESESNVPRKAFWRRRLIDAKIDKCIEIVKNSAEKQPKRKQKEVDSNDNA